MKYFLNKLLPLLFIFSDTGPRLVNSPKSEHRDTEGSMEVDGLCNSIRKATELVYFVSQHK